MDETDRPRAQGVADDRRQPCTNVVQLFEQRQRPLEHAAPARNPGRRDQHQPPHPIRLLQRQLRRHQPTQRMSENVHSPKPNRVEQTPQPRRHLTRTQTPQPRQLHQTKPPALRKPLHERLPPTPRARQPVHHHQILPLPHQPAAHRPPVNHHPPRLHTTSLQQLKLVASERRICAQSPRNLAIASIGRNVAANVLLRKRSQEAFSSFRFRPLESPQRRMDKGIDGIRQKRTGTVGTSSFSFASRRSPVRSRYAPSKSSWETAWFVPVLA